MIAQESTVGIKTEDLNIKHLGFVHYRLLDEKADDELSARGGYTFAYYEGKNVVVAAIAKCRKDELYNKKLGIQVASDILLSELKGTNEAKVNRVAYFLTKLYYNGKFRIMETIEHGLMYDFANDWCQVYDDFLADYKEGNLFRTALSHPY